MRRMKPVSAVHAILDAVQSPEAGSLVTNGDGKFSNCVHEAYTQHPIAEEALIDEITSRGLSGGYPAVLSATLQESEPSPTTPSPLEPCDQVHMAASGFKHDRRIDDGIPPMPNQTSVMEPEPQKMV